MAITINATLCSHNANSLITPEEITTYYTDHAGHAYASAWGAGGAEALKAAAIAASKAINAFIFADGPFYPVNCPWHKWRMPIRDGKSYIAGSSAASSTTTNIYWLDGINYRYKWPNDYFNNGAVAITESTGNAMGEIQHINDYDSATGKITTDSFSAAPASKSINIILPLERSFPRIFEALCIQAGRIIFAAPNFYATQNEAAAGYIDQSSAEGGRAGIKTTGARAGLDAEAYELIRPHLMKSMEILRG
jgi:hypothetical protein